MEQCGEYKSDHSGQCANPALWEITNPDAPGVTFYACGKHLSAACRSAQYGHSEDTLYVASHVHPS